jgi:hypothetical protein
MLTVSPTIERARTRVQILARRFKKKYPRLTHIFFDLIMNYSYKLYDNQLNLDKIYISYIFFLKATVVDLISTTDNPTILLRLLYILY